MPGLYYVRGTSPFPQARLPWHCLAPYPVPTTKRPYGRNHPWAEHSGDPGRPARRMPPVPSILQEVEPPTKQASFFSSDFLRSKHFHSRAYWNPINFQLFLKQLTPHIKDLHPSGCASPSPTPAPIHTELGSWVNYTK